MSNLKVKRVCFSAYCCDVEGIPIILVEFILDSFFRTFHLPRVSERDDEKNRSANAFRHKKNMMAYSATKEPLGMSRRHRTPQPFFDVWKTSSGNLGPKKHSRSTSTETNHDDFPSDPSEHWKTKMHRLFSFSYLIPSWADLLGQSGPHLHCALHSHKTRWESFHFFE